MQQSLEERIRGLAEPLWESAARPYGLALDFWLMAEQMVLETISLSARMTETALRGETPDTAPIVDDAPAPLPVHRVQELAYHMWESAGRQQGMAADFWLSAQKHVTAIMRAQRAGGGNSLDRATALAQTFSQMGPDAYLEHVEHTAYEIWQSMGSPYGQAFECWLAAERRLFNYLSPCVVAPAADTAEAPPAPAAEAEPAAVPLAATEPAPAAADTAGLATPPAAAAAAAAATPAVAVMETEPAAALAPETPSAAPAAEAPVARQTPAAPRSRRGAARPPAAKTPARSA